MRKLINALNKILHILFHKFSSEPLIFAFLLTLSCCQYENCNLNITDNNTDMNTGPY